MIQIKLKVFSLFVWPGNGFCRFGGLPAGGGCCGAPLFPSGGAMVFRLLPPNVVNWTYPIMRDAPSRTCDAFCYGRLLSLAYGCVDYRTCCAYTFVYVRLQNDAGRTFVAWDSSRVLPVRPGHVMPETSQDYSCRQCCALLHQHSYHSQNLCHCLSKPNTCIYIYIQQ